MGRRSVRPRSLSAPSSFAPSEIGFDLREVRQRLDDLGAAIRTSVRRRWRKRLAGRLSRVWELLEKVEAAGADEQRHRRVRHLIEEDALVEHRVVILANARRVVGGW